MTGVGGGGGRETRGGGDCEERGVERGLWGKG